MSPQPMSRARHQPHAGSKREQMQGNNSWPHSHQRAMDGETLFHLCGGVWREKRPGHVARIASEMTSPGITSQELKLIQGSLSLLLR